MKSLGGGGRGNTQRNCLKYMQYSAISVSIKCYFQHTVKIQDSNDSFSAKKKKKKEYGVILVLQLKAKLKLSCCGKKKINYTNMHVGTCHIQVYVLHLNTWTKPYKIWKFITPAIMLYLIYSIPFKKDKKQLDKAQKGSSGHLTSRI